MALISEIAVEYDLAALFKNQIHIKLVRLNIGHVSVERNAGGKVNLMELLTKKKDEKQLPSPAQTAEKTTPPKKLSPPKPRAKKKPMDVKIDRVEFSLGEATYTDYTSGSPVARQLPLEIQNAVLKDVTDPFRVTEQIVYAILKKVGISVIGKEIEKAAANLQWQAEQMAGQFGSFVNSLGEKFK